MQFEDHTTCSSALEVCGIQSVDQTLDQHLTRAEETEEVVEHKAAFSGALKGLEAARKYMHQFDTKTRLTKLRGFSPQANYI
jgi:hypothetical protein